MNFSNELNSSSRSLTTEQRDFIIVLHSQKKTYPEIKDAFFKAFRKDIYDSTISRLVTKKKETGTVDDRDRPGRPPIYGEREERALVRYALQNPKESLRELERNREVNFKEASKQTLSRVFEKYDVVSRVLPSRLEDLTKDHVKSRKKFANEHINWTFDDWSQVVFSDEADIFPTYCGKQYMRVKRGQNPLEVVGPGGGLQKKLTIKVWGAISSRGVGPLIQYQESMRKKKYLTLLKGHLLQNYPDLENGLDIEEDPDPPYLPLSFMDDNASCHRAHIVTNWKDKKRLKVLDWPSNSPDINIIENVWARVEDRLYDIKGTLKTSQDTWDRTVEIWNNIELDFIVNLYNSLPNRMKELKKMKGGAIHY